VDHNTREEIRKQVRENLHSLTKKEVMEATKEAVKELVREHVTMFGWWSLKTLSVSILGAVIIFAIYVENHKWL